MTRNQLDLFQADEQPELFPEDAAPIVYRADPDRIRLRLARILAEARASERMPWDSERLRLYRRLVPQMSMWLPEEEAAQLTFEFEQELERLKAA
ncbi:hypothetical protein [Nitratireductor luteus]|uniref:hypothetical protein n=1 Tax=Nitratireductor luteus TaxID=2976980 RepID=UPI00223F655F|nr:hypothetical protein [Nitratireductor luteus]